MITRTMVDKLFQGQVLLHVSQKNADGTPQRWKITSIKTWKTRPEDFEVRVKWGLKTYAKISNGSNDHELTPDFEIHCPLCYKSIKFSESIQHKKGVLYCYSCYKLLPEGD